MSRLEPLPAESQLWECDGCARLTVCTRAELASLEHWTWHGGTRTGGGTWHLLLCGPCEAAAQPTQAHAI